jgi:predicted DNA-binding WGR domain protein
MNNVKMICISTGQNSHKFWHGEILPTGNLKVSWGRIGSKGQEKIHEFGNFHLAQSKLNQLIAEKRRKGYEQTVIDTEAELLEFSQLSIGETILEMITTLEEWLQPWQAKVDIRFDRQTGQLVSPLGHIDRRRIQEAHRSLEEVNRNCQSHSGWFIQSVEEYLKIIPWKSQGRLNPQELLGSTIKIQQHQEFLQLLGSCLEMIWEIRKLIWAELENPTIAVADKAQWVEWGELSLTNAVSSIDEGRMAAIEW